MFRGVKDSPWSADHVVRHGVTLDEVREAILEHPYWTASGKNDTALIYGRTDEGRYLLVVAVLVVAVEDEGEAFIVTARDMTASEKKTFHRKVK